MTKTKTKPNTPKPTLRAKASDPTGWAFRIWLEPTPSFTLTDLVRLEAQMQAYAERHQLLLMGHQLRWSVSSSDHDVGATDQVNLLDWLTNQPGVAAVRIGPVLPVEQAMEDLGDGAGAGVGVVSGASASTPVEAYLRASTVDPTLLGLKLLYRAARITPALYLQILGGFVTPAALH